MTGILVILIVLELICLEKKSSLHHGKNVEHSLGCDGTSCAMSLYLLHQLVIAFFALYSTRYLPHQTRPDDGLEI